MLPAVATSPASELVGVLTTIATGRHSGTGTLSAIVGAYASNIAVAAASSMCSPERQPWALCSGSLQHVHHPRNRPAWKRHGSSSLW